MEQDYLLNKWLNEGLTEAEMKEFQARPDYEEHMAIIENASMFRASQFSELDDFDSFQKKLSNRTSGTHKPSWFKPLLRMAAVLVAGVALFYFLFTNDQVLIETLAGQKTEVELPDASLVVINALSEIRYDEDSWSKNRVIELEGEAFFDVSKGNSFDVVTSMGTVSVLGTEFNVKQRKNFFEVRCFEGKVQVKTPLHLEILEPGEHLLLYKDQLQLGQNRFKQPDWVKNMSSFQRVPLSEVFAELERQYDIELKIQDAPVTTLFTGSFVHGNLENALQSITQPLNLVYRIETPKHVSIYPSDN